MTNDTPTPAPAEDGPAQAFAPHRFAAELNTAAMRLTDNPVAPRPICGVLKRMAAGDKIDPLKGYPAEHQDEDGTTIPEITIPEALRWAADLAAKAEHAGRDPRGHEWAQRYRAAADQIEEAGR